VSILHYLLAVCYALAFAPPYDETGLHYVNNMRGIIHCPGLNSKYRTLSPIRLDSLCKKGMFLFSVHQSILAFDSPSIYGILIPRMWSFTTPFAYSTQWIHLPTIQKPSNFYNTTLAQRSQSLQTSYQLALTFKTLKQWWYTPILLAICVLQADLLISSLFLLVTFANLVNFLWTVPLLHAKGKQKSNNANIGCPDTCTTKKPKTAPLVQDVCEIDLTSDIENQLPPPAASASKGQVGSKANSSWHHEKATPKPCPHNVASTASTTLTIPVPVCSASVVSSEAMPPVSCLVFIISF